MKFVSNKLLRARPLLGTFVEITASGLDANSLERAIAAAFGAVARVHALMSFHERDSDVSRLNRANIDEALVVDHWTYEVLAASAELERQSNGRFNVGVAPALQLLGLLPDLDQDHASTRVLACDNAFELLPGERVRMRKIGARIDLGGIAKGFAVDRAIDVLQQHGIESGLVNAGGDLAAFGSEDHVVGIRDPGDRSRLLCCVAVQNAGIASSGLLFDPLTAGQKAQSAVIDPGSGRPVMAICGATVCAPSCMVADALTKVVMIAGTGASETLDHYAANALLVSSDGEVEVTADWQDAFSIAA
jgi:FAD:protein FMN transferase